MYSQIVWKLNANKTITKVEKGTTKLYAGSVGTPVYALVGEKLISTDVVFIIATRNGVKYGQKLTYGLITYKDGTTEYGWKTASNGAELNFELQSGTQEISFNFNIKRYSTIGIDKVVEQFNTSSDVVNVYPSGSYYPQMEASDVDEILEELAKIDDKIARGDLVARSFYAYKSDFTYNIDEIVFDSTQKAFYKSLIDNNLGNAVTDTTKWVKVELQDIINILNMIGDLSELETEEKDNLVDAINEVNAKKVDEERTASNYKTVIDRKFYSAGSTRNENKGISNRTIDTTNPGNYAQIHTGLSQTSNPNVVITSVRNYEKDSNITVDGASGITIVARNQDTDERKTLKVEANKVSINNKQVATEDDLALKQNKTDNALQTTNKTVVGAINELKDEIDDFTEVAIDNTTITKNDNDELQAVAITDGEEVIDVDEINNIREIASGKESGWVIDSQSQITGTKDSDENYTNVTAITGLDLSLIKVGDNIYIINTQQPDYWVSGKTEVEDVITLKLNTLTTKVDLTNYVDKTSNETITGRKTFTQQIQTPSLTDGTNTITVEEIVDLQDEKLDKEVTQTSEDEETTVKLENNGQDFEVRITENGSVDKTIAITKDGLEFIDNETGDYFAPKINGEEITGITEIELEGESGTLTDDEFAKLQANPNAVVFSLDGRKFIHNEDATNYVSYSNTVYPTTETQETKVIYVNTSSEAVNYKHWNVEDEEPSGAVSIDGETITENSDGEIQAVELKNKAFSVGTSAITFGNFKGTGHFESDEDFALFVSQGYIEKGGVRVEYDENGIYTTPSSSSQISIDGTSITENSDGEIQAEGVIDQKTGNANKEWTGTRAEYDLITTKDPNTFYNITDEQDVPLEEVINIGNGTTTIETQVYPTLTKAKADEIYEKYTAGKEIVLLWQPLGIDTYFSVVYASEISGYEIDLVAHGKVAKYSWTSSTSTDIVPTISSGGQLYRHDIQLYNSTIIQGVTLRFSLINSSSTLFTSNTLKQWLYDNGYISPKKFHVSSNIRNNTTDKNKIQWVEGISYSATQDKIKWHYSYMSITIEDNNIVVSNVSSSSKDETIGLQSDKVTPL